MTIDIIAPCTSRGYLVRISSVRVPMPQGKQGKWKKKNPCQGKHREFGNFAKTQEIWFAQIFKFPVPKSKKYFGICSENFHFSEDLDKAVLCM